VPVVQSALRRRVAVAGIGATRQGTHEADVPQLGLDAFRAALDDAGMQRREIDGVLGCQLGAAYSSNYGIEPNSFCQALGLAPHVTGRLEYGTGGFTTQYAAMLVATGVCSAVACVFGMNPRHAVGKLTGSSIFDGVHGYKNAAAYAGLGWTQYLARHRIDESTGARALGLIAVSQRGYARLNENAAWRDELTLESYLSESPLIWPLRPSDIARRTAGAVAIIVTSAERARDCPKVPVLFESLGRHEAARNIEDEGYFTCEAMSLAARQAYDSSDFGPETIDVLGVSDASTVAVIQTLENYGFCGKGEAIDYVESGAIGHGGSMPVNTDGGQLSCGYMVGWLHQVELVSQLRSEAKSRQVPDARVAQYCTTGGSREHFLTTIYVRDEGK
jgi:acetyl-CoA acetyltransferase